MSTALLALLSSPVLAGETGDVFVTLQGKQVGEIFVDGQPTGVSAPGTLKVPAGNHMIQVKGDCLSDTRSVDVGADEVARLEMNLQPLGGFVQLSATPAEAEVKLDGKPISMPTAIELTCGRHVLEATADRYLPLEQELMVDMGGAYRIDLALSLDGFGQISVVVNPVDATVFLDGTEVAVGPTTLSEVPKGKHLITARKDGMSDREAEVSVASGETTRIELDLTPGGDAPTEVAITVPPTEAEKKERERNANLPKLAAGGGLLVVGAGSLAGGGAMLSAANKQYGIYETDFDTNGDGYIDPPLEADAKSFFADEVRPRKVKAYTLFGVGAVALAAGTGVVVLVDSDGAMVGYTARF
jgi:hypothetical protein